jgi:hypothetical protein
MSRVLYYSNYCSHCKNILLKLSKSDIKSDIHFLCIDKRFTIEDKVYLILENGDKILLPKNIIKVPALMLLNRKNEVLFGNDIHNHFDVLIKNSTELKNMDTRTAIMEPESYSMEDSSGFVRSDMFSFVDMTPEQLSAKGNGGTRMMYNYSNLNNNDKIHTPAEDYTPNKVNAEDIKKYEEARTASVPRMESIPRN